MGVKSIYLLAVVGVLGGYVWHSVGMSKVFEPSSKEGEQIQGLEDCIAELNQVKNEVNMRLRYAQYQANYRAIQAYRPLAFELLAIERRLTSPDCDPDIERQKVGAIKAKLSPRPQRK